MTDTKEIDLNFCLVKYKDPIIFLIFRENAELDTAEIREMTRAAEKLTGGKPYLLLSDARVNMTISSEGRKVAADKTESPLLIANAALINNLGLILTANVFIRLNQPHFKYKTFNSEEKAIKWLMQFDPNKK